MKPVDIRNAQWSEIVERVTGDRALVYNLWLNNGPLTNRELAEKTGRDLLSIAPRTTELLQLGLLECIGQKAHRGVYKATPIVFAQAVFESRRKELVQPELPLRAAQ